MTEQTNPVTSQELKQGFGLSLLWGILMIVLGVVAIARPLFAGVATNFYLGWVIVLGGIAQFIYAIQTRESGQFFWKLLIGVFYVAAGLLLLIYPLEGLLSLTLIVAVGILGSGLTQIFGAFLWRPDSGWGWLLARGILVTVLGIWVLVDWPGNTTWLIGSLVGINFISDGIGIATFSAVAREVINQSQSAAAS